MLTNVSVKALLGFLYYGNSYKQKNLKVYLGELEIISCMEIKEQTRKFASVVSTTLTRTVHS